MQAVCRKLSGSESVCEDRIGTGPPRARTKVIYVDLGYWAISIRSSQVALRDRRELFECVRPEGTTTLSLSLSLSISRSRSLSLSHTLSLALFLPLSVYILLFFFLVITLEPRVE